MLAYPDDDLIRCALEEVKTIAMVGASPKQERPSYGVMEFLLAAGYRVFPVNPGHDGSKILGQLVYAKLADLPEPVDMIDVFRRPETLGPLVDEVLAMDPRPRVFWTQLGVVNPEATDRAAAAGLRVIVDRCPAIEYPRLIRRVRRAIVH
jgi:uncharacterized protein